MRRGREHSESGRRWTAVPSLAGRLGVALLGVGLTLWAVARLFRPDLSAPPPPPPPEEVAEAERLRDPGIDPRSPPRLQVDVDYTEGPAAAWYPRHESPVLADLVREGRLPPVADRVGPEPVVYRGPDAIGRYGGTSIAGGGDVSALENRLSATTLVRWSPQGYPLVPHLAKSWDVSDDYRVYTFHLRRGVRWSDGRPFTADDIIYWWEHEANDPRILGTVPRVMKVHGQVGRIEKVDALSVRFAFPEPHGLFLPMMAMSHGLAPLSCPAHYLRPYHPDPSIGDTNLIAHTMAALRLASPVDVYRHVKRASNPEHPRLWPWLFRTYTPNPPYSLVRNPYYWMVDPEGNQLPYVDRIRIEQVSPSMVNASVASGRFTLTANKPLEYTLLMGARKDAGYRVYRWFRADACDAMIHPNLNRKVDPDRPDTAWKHRLLNEKTFRQALSLAIDRQAIIDAIYFGEPRPAQCAPGPESFFFNPRAFSAFTELDPERANRLLDGLGLTRRDREGMRTAPDGTRLTFFLNHASWLNPMIAQFVADDWRRVGIRTIPRMRESRLFYAEKAALVQDFSMFTGENEFVPILEPRVFLPVSDESNFALGYAKWFMRGGLYGDPDANEANGCVPVPEDHPLRRAMKLYEGVRATGDRERQRELFDQILDISAENTWTIGLCTSPMYLVTVKDGFLNVPKSAAITFSFLSAGNCGQETFFFEHPEHPPGVAEDIRREIADITPEPRSLATADANPDGRAGSGWLAHAIRWLLLGSGLALLAMAVVRHPYVGRRLLIMVPTLLFISVVVFSIIELPPGDYLSARIMQLQMSGDQVDEAQLETLKSLYHLGDPAPLRYARWMGLAWFASFDPADAGLLQGNLGRAMSFDNLDVNQVVGDRILLTFLMSFGTILFTWAVALPIGILSAVRQYKPEDYVFTLFGFLGMCIPSFLLALIFMFLSQKFLGLHVDRLFSEAYALQPFWDWPKVVDLLKHLWVPVLILGVGGTAGMIRVMRGNLLDELRKPYVTTARAKGVRPLKLLLKYPVRIALNPFVSGIGGLFPALISGGTLVSVVLSLPTVGPLMLNALMNEDTMLAGSMLMVLSLLGIFGVLVSDLLLLWLDPRIRFEGGSK